MTRQEALGEMILSEKKFRYCPTSEAADWIFKYYQADLPENRKNESMGTETAKAYREELRNNPDKHAQEMLKHLEEGVEISEDPSGN